MLVVSRQVSRGADWAGSCAHTDGNQNTQNPPLAPAGGEGSGVRWQSTPLGGRGSRRAPLRAQPCCGSAGASPSRYGPQAGHQFHAGCPRRPPAPSRSRLVVDRVEPGAWCGIARRPAWVPGYLHPSPPAPLPFQGRGVPGAPATERTHRKAERRKHKDPRSAQQCNCLMRSREQDTSGPAENRKLTTEN